MTGAIRGAFGEGESGADLSVDSDDLTTPTRTARAGDVYEVDVGGERGTVAVVRPRLQGELTEATAAYLDGVRTWAAVDDHEAVVDVLGWGETAEGPWVATPLPGDGTLADRLEAGALPADRALSVGLDCARGVAHLHENRVYHHALTPERVVLDGDSAMITGTGTGPVLDGAAGGIDALSVARAAPEQFDPGAFGDPDARTDVYRLGAVVYEALTGRPPFEGGETRLVERLTDRESSPAPPSEHAAVPDGVDEVVGTALATDPRERYHTVEAFATALAGLDAVATDAVGVSSGAPEQWRQFGGGAAHTGHHPDRGPSAPVEPFWRDGTGYHEVGSAPVVADGTVYYGAEDAVRAVDVATGQLAWAVDLPAAVTAAPAVADGSVYVVSDDTVYAFGAADGTEQWTFEAARMRAAPTVAEGAVYVGCNDGAVYAIDAADGAQRWSAATGAPVSGAPAVADGTVYVGTTDGTVFALDAADGGERWRADGMPAVKTAPAVRYGTVYVPAGGTVRALDADGGGHLWTAETDANLLRSPAVDGGSVYVGTEGAGLYALDADAGHRQWVYADGETTTPAAVTDGTVYVGTAGGTLAAVDAVDGTAAWTLDLGEGVTTAPGLGASDLFVGTDDGSLCSVRSERDTPGHGSAGGDVTVPPVADLQPPAGDWTSAGGTPGRTRAVGPGPTDADGTEWTYEPDADLSPVTLTDAGTAFVGDDRATLHAIDADERELLWVAEGTDHDDREVVTDGERVYAVGDRFADEDGLAAADDRVTALDAETGEVCWETETDGEYRSPTAVGGTVYVADDSGVTAVDAENGEPVWTATVGCVGAPAVGYGTVYVAGDRTVTALDAGLGVEQWTAETPEFAAGPPALGGERVVIATDQGGVYAFDAATGDRVWNATVGDRLRCSVTVADGTVYAGTDGAVVAFDATTGDRQWEASVDALIRDPLAVSDGAVYAATDDGLYVLEAATGGELLHRGAPGESHPGAPAVGGGSVLYVDGDDVLRSVGPGPQTPGPEVDRSKTAGEDEDVFDAL